uniref:Macaca fascicularis brain cDNA, clone: QccE-21331 n=1 Tax=Macaca fascicularis TaxID=9541 RepID=I7GAF6_MACFA|nr:unnamed protein product [Macaca fascicularis]
MPIVLFCILFDLELDTSTYIYCIFAGRKVDIIERAWQ